MDRSLSGLKMGEGLTIEGQVGILGGDEDVLYHDNSGDYLTLCIYQHSLTYTG